jgi:two-component system, chemotaxis family, chemotaxis protein CheY
MRILVVDDSKAMRMIVKRTLRQAGFEDVTVDEASNGVEALQLYKASKADLILADWNMPEMSGIELLRALKAEVKDIKFGFVTSEGTPEMRQKAKEEGALFMITKPFTVESFQKELAVVLS